MYRLALRQPARNALQRALQQQQLCREYSRGPNAGGTQEVLQASFGKVLLILSPVIAVGGAIAYANYDQAFRKLLEQNVPGAAKIIRIGLQEESLFKDVSKQFDSVTKSVEGVTSSVTGLFGSGATKETPKKAEETKEKPTSKPATSVKPTANSAKPTATPATSVVEVKKPDPLPKDVLDLEKAVEMAAALAVKEYNHAISVLKNFNEDVRKVVDHAVEHVDTAMWTTLKNKTSARDTSVMTAERLAHEALEKIERCQVALSKATTADNHAHVQTVRDKIKTLTDHINGVKDELYKHKDLANISEKYWRNVESARNYFIDEIESIFPGLNLAEKKLELSKEDLDLFITHAYSHVLALQKELQRLQTDGELRLKRAIEAYRGGENDSEATRAQLDYQLEVEKRQLAIENQKKIFHIRADAEKTLRHQLKQQAEAHVDHLKDALELKENEMKRNYSRELEDKLAVEKANYKLQLAGMLGKMRGMDAALQARAEAERCAHQSQALWAACQALWSTVRTGEAGTHWRSKLRPLQTEIKAIAKVAEGDELVAVVLENLPQEAASRGVYPEDALRERFINVERVARKVALVPEGGASIPTYILSCMQSWFILRPDDPVSQDELQNKKFDYSKLDTYDILNRARYFVDRGDLLQALKYMNLLQGAPRKVSREWQKETLLLLETQQAANTLMAHAAASGLLYL